MGVLRRFRNSRGGTDNAWIVDSFDWRIVNFIFGRHRYLIVVRSIGYLWKWKFYWKVIIVKMRRELLIFIAILINCYLILIIVARRQFVSIRVSMDELNK